MSAAEAEEADTDKGREVKESLEKAVTAVDEMLSTEQCALLVEAVVTKYVALSPEEMQEWQVSQQLLCGNVQLAPSCGAGGRYRICNLRCLKSVRCGHGWRRTCQCHFSLHYDALLYCMGMHGPYLMDQGATHV